MSFYDDASLVFLAGGAAGKDGKAYSLKPTDGGGDFTFTRGSNLTATRVGKDGYIEKGRENLLLYSNQFDSWTVVDATATSGQTGYDGTSDAWLFTTTVAGASLEKSITASGVVVFSMYAKKGTVDGIRLRIDAATDADAYFNLSNNSVHSFTGSAIDASITDLGGGWQRCKVYANISSPVKVAVYTTDGTTAYDNGNIYIQDAQFEYGLVATDYLESGSTTGKAGVLDNLPRIDYTSGSAQLLMEPSRTNLYTNSEYFDDWLSNRLDRTANNIISPEGVQNAYKVAQQSGFTTAPNVNKGGIAAGTYTVSIFAKKGSWNYLAISFQGVSYFNLETGSKGTINSNHTATIEHYGNGWYRCAITRTTTTTETPAFYFAESDNTLTTPDTQGYMYIYGAQLEAASYATSYIPNYGTALGVTRDKDVSSITGVSSLIGSTEGTIYLEVAALANDLSDRRFALSDGTTNNVARVGFTSVSNRIVAVLYNGTNQCVLTYDGADITETNKIAFTYAANDFALYVNGESRSTDVSGVTFSAGTLSEIRFNEGDGSGNESYGKFDKVMIFPTRLTNNELAALTA